ncbi:membrane protein [Litorihabitans aurantiacus]|uniref:Membrane protein n=1 Tax=Litorihabitans aurantiacus TaxID=1930061 RepID=A0AA37XGN3_9MICO|nr:membrane protein [Litorihabitans aurantiacus]
MFVGSARAVVAAALAGLALAITRQRRPSRTQALRLAAVAGGVVLGFPLLTSLALTTAPAGHGAVVVGLLPVATAAAVVVRTGERPGRAFWVLAGLGALAGTAFAALQSGGGLHLAPSDLLLLGAVLAGAVGYAEGGLLARELGSWQTVSWALVLAAPVTIAVASASAVHEAPVAGPQAWAAFAYLAAVSMFLGFFAWYRGLAIGPMAQVSQVQLVQPVLSFAWAGLILHEHIGWPTALGGLVVVVLAGASVRTRLRRAERPGRGGASSSRLPGRTGG